MMKYIVVSWFLVAGFLFTNCTKEWEQHYFKTGESVNSKLWDTLQTMDKYSEFVYYMELFKLDHIIKSNNTKTLFIPDNDAIKRYLDLDSDTSIFREALLYHIVPTFFTLQNVTSQYRLETISKKYLLVENLANSFKLDGIDVINVSALFLDGKYYEVAEVLVPKPNLYQYLLRYNPSVAKYIDLQDTIILDRAKSTPIGFDEFGRTIYDSVTVKNNAFEMGYFPISKEFSNISATLVIPSQALYDNALDQMAVKLGGIYKDHKDIPQAWQNNFLNPLLLNKGIYGGWLSPESFNKTYLANVRGDSILVDFSVDPQSKVIASNGIAYSYLSYSIPERFFLERTIEGETFCRSIGLNRFAWNESIVKIDGDKALAPVKQKVPNASNDSILNIEFGRNYAKNYSLSFNIRHVFPGKYRLVWRTAYRNTGIYSIYVNGVKVRLGLMSTDKFDTNDLARDNGFFSVMGYKLFPDAQGYCSIDGWVNNITEYGDVTIKIEYLGPGGKSDNGLTIDYIKLIHD